MIQSLTASASACFTVREACAALGVSESGFYARGFYAHRHKAERPRRRQDSVIIGKRHLSPAKAAHASPHDAQQPLFAVRAQPGGGLAACKCAPATLSQ